MTPWSPSSRWPKRPGGDSPRVPSVTAVQPPFQRPTVTTGRGWGPLGVTETPERPWASKCRRGTRLLRWVVTVVPEAGMGQDASPG